MLYGIFVPFAVQFGTVLDSTGRPKDNFIFTVASVVVNLALNFFFVSSLGTIGAAYGTLVAYFLGFIAMQMYLYRVFGVTTISSFFYMVYFYGLIWRELLKFLLKKR
jgi:Na+-driven multidrug efflux pump